MQAYTLMFVEWLEDMNHFKNLGRFGVLQVNLKFSEPIMASRPWSHRTFVNESLDTSNAFWKVGFCSDETFHGDSAGHPTHVPYIPQGTEQLCCLSWGSFFWVTI